jgi:SAM-dependent methyltransferase
MSHAWSSRGGEHASISDRIRALIPPRLKRRVELFRMSSRIASYGYPAARRLVAAIESGADRKRIRELRTEMLSAYRNDPAGAAKYTDCHFWLALNLERAARLGLHRTRGLRIMDIGCGAGYFLAAARALGHECAGTDVPASHFNPVERRVYTEILEANGCRSYVSPLFIERFTPLPFVRDSYDLITAFWVCFNRHRQADEWGAAEWRFFIEDALGVVRRGGRIVLELNANPERYGEAGYYDAETAALFRSVGTLEGNWVTIQRSA